MKISEMIEVLQHAQKGGVVEYVADSRGWTPVVKWDMRKFCMNIANGYHYRIKPESKRIPLNEQDLIERIKYQPMCVKNGKAHRFIQDFNDETVFFSDDEFTYEQFASLEWYDGKPCSKASE